jgi:hypothetical protein
MLAVAMALAGSLAVPTAASAADDPLQTDLALLAAKRGWTIQQANVHYAMSEEFGLIQERIVTARPEMFVGAKLPRTPGGAPTLYLKGKADSFVRDLLGSASFPITVVEDRPLSQLELVDRAVRLDAELGRLGFRDIVTAFDMATSRISADMTRVPGLPTTAQGVLAVLPPDLRQDVSLYLSDNAVSVKYHAYGGTWMRDGAANECTAGWSVTDGSTTGITTAGHCDGIDRNVQPGVGWFSVTHQAQHTTTYGDVEWKTSAEHSEPDDFYADASDFRDVASIEARANILVGEGVCGYGRSSNFRDCDLVYDTWMPTCGGTQRLVGMETDDTFTFGDSGGGWSMNTRAYGSIVGACSVAGVWHNTWSIADLYDEALGVTVRTS